MIQDSRTPRIKIDNRRPERFENLVSYEILEQGIDVPLIWAASTFLSFFGKKRVTCVLTFKDHIDTYGRVSWKKDTDGSPLLCLRELIGNEIL